MQNNNEQNPYRPPQMDYDDYEEFRGIKPSWFERMITVAAVFCSLFPLINLVLELVYLSSPIHLHRIGDQHYIFIAGTWFYALLSIPAAIGIGIFKSRTMLIYGIFITMFFCFMSSILWAATSSSKDPEMIYPAMFGIPPATLCAIYAIIYFSSICVYFLAREPFHQRKS